MTVKERTRKEFLNKARQVFADKGIAEATMDEIALAGGKTRRTIYRHFTNKEDLAYEVLMAFFDDWNDYITSVYNGLEGSGIKKLEVFLYKMKNYMEDRMSIMAFVAEYDIYFSDKRPQKVSDDTRSKFMVSDVLIEKIILEGIKDGSIELKKDLKMLVSTMASVLWGFGQRIAYKGESISQELGLDSRDILSCQIDMYLDYLRVRLK
ncbi:TetR/AcrR family transcriptional regulator [Acidaminobacter sp. JC074]|uniref:TetR/AcrR family transcriptional regulator n=1 Tax=Acidaminobacter sp. JC074 TaxID=2530199 RepID=UPI001F102790|nr:TetR/AcrR family transcriptional regulator [Acidaminobacter sp. JC074]